MVMGACAPEANGSIQNAEFGVLVKACWLQVNTISTRLVADSSEQLFQRSVQSKALAIGQLLIAVVVDIANTTDAPGDAKIATVFEDPDFGE